MSQSLGQSETMIGKLLRFLAKGGTAALGALGLTVLGDSAFGYLSHPTWSPSWWVAWQVVLYVGVFIAACITFDDLLRKLRSWFRPETGSKDSLDVETPDALVSIVSRNPADPREPLEIANASAFVRTIDKVYVSRQEEFGGTMRHVYLICSSTSKAVATAYIDAHREEYKEFLEFHDPVTADFNSTQDCHAKTSKAIRLARSHTEVSTVAVDITGGTKPSSVGAVLAGMDRKAELFYWQQDFPHDLRGIDVGWRK